MTLPGDLRGPVTVALSRSEASIPAAASLPGGARYEPKWDGYRVVAIRDEEGVRLWSRQGKDLTGRLPDLAVAARDQLSPGTVLDGEAVIWNGDRLDFDLLQRRLVSARSGLASLAAAHPATFMVFDVLAVSDVDVRSRRLQERREILEDLSTSWRPPLQLTPSTRDEQTARQWFTDYRPAGVEGLVVKAARGVYAPGRRSWVKVKSRESVDVIVGAVTGSLTRPETVVAGRVRDGVLHIVGRTTPLAREQAVELADALTPAGPEHPWPDEVSSNRFGSGRDKVPLVKVEPVLVAEVLADAAMHAGGYRHPLRYLRLRADLTTDDIHP
ncbi:ATP-dependent DNA ligase [Nostocoides sp. F2B08]|uniref:ATP-dependent DNA ligase n=1 Tax=Nostocoides sp. F2B08 TaxID=2653936 RepID=UPI001263D5C6|nr:ATP-dependent DNA ligase [Tetrasphaera sp. F2B08]KAB7740360.1 ATP-dependent DNA ligase [Tetrasphaera sp. F2B08]